MAVSPHASIAARSAGSRSGSSTADRTQAPPSMIGTYPGRSSREIRRPDPGEVLIRELARPERGRGERPRLGVVLVEVALPRVERLGDTPDDDRGRVVAGERRGDLGAGLDRQPEALGLGGAAHRTARGSAGSSSLSLGYRSEAGTQATISAKHGNTLTPPVDAAASRRRSLPDGPRTGGGGRSRYRRACRYYERYPLQKGRTGAVAGPALPFRPSSPRRERPARSAGVAPRMRPRSLAPDGGHVLPLPQSLGRPP